MERKQLVKPQNTETVENVAVYVCETKPNTWCPTNSSDSCGSGCPCGTNYSVCGGKCGDNCPDLTNANYCGDRCGS